MVIAALLACLSAALAAPAVTTTSTATTATTTAPVTSSVSVDQRALILTTGDGSEECPEFTLQSYGIPYDVVTVSAAAQLDTPLPLEYAPGQGKYSFIILSNGQMSAQFPNGSFLSTLYPWQKAQIESYQATYQARLVALNDQPDGTYVSRYGGFWGTGDANMIAISAASYATAAGIQPSVTLPTSGLWHVPGTIFGTTVASEFLRFLPVAPNYPVNTTAGAILNFGTRQQMSFYMAFGSWSTSSLVLSHIYVQWATRGLYPGFRRIYFTPQIDDFFLTTDGNNENGTFTSFRSSPADMDGLIAWQTDITSRLPKGSSLKFDMCINGNGILDKISGTTDYLVDFDPDQTDTSLDWIKPPGTGYTLWPALSALNTNWLVSDLNTDPLFKYFANATAKINAFFWNSHTFTHEILNNNSYSDTWNEVFFNYRMAGKQYLGLTQTNNWSNFSMVTPGISGLFNADALKALMDFGITAAVGDSSRLKTNNPVRPIWWPLTTDVEGHGYAGFTIIPRQVLNIFFNVTNANYNTVLYNNIYGGSVGFDYIMDQELLRCGRLMMALNWQGWMFHQANLRNADMPSIRVPGTTKSMKLGIAQNWTEQILYNYTQYATWPIVSIKEDDLVTAFRNRYIYENAGVRVWYTGPVGSNGATVSSLSVTAATSCTAPVTMPSSVTLAMVNAPTGGRLEQIGNDPVTVWVPLVGGASATQITFKAPITF
ncbi:hypothetical protein HK101_003639 [Irineochytrium annulatum]|nr:hypothetical protein HK101_003639 [Irineochytrium annulatum]